MKTLQEEITEYETLKDALHAAQQAVNAKALHIAQTRSVIEKGQAVEINGWSYKGKSMLVKRVIFEQYYPGYQFRVLGYVLKKDGTPGNQNAESIYPIEHNKEPAA